MSKILTAEYCALTLGWRARFVQKTPKLTEQLAGAIPASMGLLPDRPYNCSGPADAAELPSDTP